MMMERLRQFERHPPRLIHYESQIATRALSLHPPKSKRPSRSPGRSARKSPLGSARIVQARGHRDSRRNSSPAAEWDSVSSTRGSVPSSRQGRGRRGCVSLPAAKGSRLPALCERRVKPARGRVRAVGRDDHASQRDVRWCRDAPGGSEISMCLRCSRGALELSP